ncbi:MAG: alpha/beta hydrolase [Ancrocorticia sp.]
MKISKKLAGLLAGAALALGACSPATSGDEASASPTLAAGAVPIDAPMPAIPAGLEAYYNQKLAWSPCEGGLDCATITVPLDYAQPGGQDIKIAVSKRPAEGKAIGTLVINPGGPGASGVAALKNAIYFFDSEIRTSFDILGFDPRGVGKSNPIDCVDDVTLTGLLDGSYDTSVPGWEAQAEADVESFVAGCSANSGDILSFIGTKYAAQDIDIIRHLVGDPKLYYMGYSYGTFLGMEYAEQFPGNTGRLVLDGPVDTTIGVAQMSHDQTMGFEMVLRRYLEDCLESGSSCPFTGSVDDAAAKVHELLVASVDSPYPTKNEKRPLVAAQFFNGMVLPLYAPSTWNMLTSAFKALIEENDGTQFQVFSDLSQERQDDGSFASNSAEALLTINCADYPPADPAELESMSAQLRENAPVMQDIQTSGANICAYWPNPPTELPGPIAAEGSAPLLVVGTRYDPATPYHWAEAVHEQLENSVLVTWNGDGHTAYSAQADECVLDAVDGYLLGGTLPEEGLVCEP